jgi:hypothetical protein
MDSDKRELSDRRRGSTRRSEDAVRIHSQELQKKFAHIYKNFFNSHDIVLSANMVFTWGSDISDRMTRIHIKQKLPKKIFCGVNMNSSGKVKL